LANKVMGRIIAEEYGENAGGNLHVGSLTLLSDVNDLVTSVGFADKSFKNNINSNIHEAYGKIYNSTIPEQDLKRTVLKEIPKV